MPIRAYLVLHRTRLLWCVFTALFVPCVVIVFTTSDNGLDFRVFWNHFCGCAPADGDAYAILYASTLTASVVGMLLALGNRSSNAYAASAIAPGLRSDLPYMLTRPMQRRSALFAPAAIALLAIVILPAVGFATVFTWMHLVHAPALAFFPKALRLVPDAALLPSSASLFSLFVAAHGLSIYLGSISMGLLAFALFYSQRWLMLSPNPWVRFVAAFQFATLFLLPTVLRRSSPHLGSALFAVPEGHTLAWHPSATLLLIHYAVPAALLLWSWRTLQAADF